MLDIKFVRNNPEVVKQNIKNKFQDDKLPLVDEVIECITHKRAKWKFFSRCPLVDQYIFLRISLCSTRLLQSS